jgi:uncharacterized membrane protein
MMLSVDALVSAVIFIIVLGLVFYLLWWLIGYVGLPEPFNKVARVLVAVVAVLILISALLGVAGHPMVRW